MNIKQSTIDEVREMRERGEEWDRAKKEREEPVRQALCDLLDRLGADGATEFMNETSPERLSDLIFAHVAWVQARALDRFAEEPQPCDAICPDRGTAGGARCHLRGPHEMHSAQVVHRATWPDHLTQDRVKS